MRFTGKHIIITGASTGIGKATAIRLAAEGARMSLLARNFDALQVLAQEIGATARAISVDVSDKTALLAALDQAVAQGGAVDGMFLNAGFAGTPAPLWELDDDVVEATMRLNAMSPYWTLKHLLPGMMARGRGAIVITGSTAGVRGSMNCAGYAMSKHAVLGLMSSVALEVAASGVRCNAVLPGFIETPMLATMPDEAKSLMASRTPQQRIGLAEEAAAVVAFLLSDDASFVTAQMLAIDGGMLGTQML